MACWYEPLVASVVGGLIAGGLTGYFSVRAVKISHRNTLELQNQNQKKLIKGFLQAIHDEIETLWELYQIGIGMQLETLPDGEALRFYYPVTQDYFTVYNSNGFLIGHIEDADLRRLIVQVYSMARGLIDSYKMNNEVLGKLEYWENLYYHNKDPFYGQSALSLLTAMQEYAKKIKKRHTELKDLIEKLLRHLRKMGVISESM
jgi:hypothetical protein